MDPGCSSTTHLERLSKPANNSLADQTTYEERMLKDCTFSPRINGQDFIGERRSLSQFLKAQQYHIDKSKSKLDHLRSQIEKEELSLIKSTKRSKSPRQALEKLYQDGKRIKHKIEQKGTQIYRELSPFSPKLVSKQTKEERDYFTLYDDAIKRLNSPSQTKLMSSPDAKSNHSVLTNRKNNDYLRKRFIADFD